MRNAMEEAAALQLDDTDWSDLDEANEPVSEEPASDAWARRAMRSNGFGAPEPAWRDDDHVLRETTFEILYRLAAG